MNSFSSDLDDGNGLLSWPELQEWILSADLPGKGEIKNCEQLSGGTQNNLFLLARADGTEMVLRRPPRHPRPHNDRTMMREAQVLAALSGSDVPHPAFYSACDDPSVIGVCFYLMAPIKGFNPFSENPEPYASNAEWYKELGLSIVDGIAALTRIDHVAVGLEDFGKPERWIERQVERWRSQLEGYSSFDAYNGPEVGGVAEVGEWLEENQPTDFIPRIIHGDVHHANVIASYEHPKLAALVDWELSTIGDPRLDLAWLLISWFDASDPDRSSPAFEQVHGGLTRNDLINHWAEQTGLSVADMDWWFVLAAFKLGILLEGTWARSLEGQGNQDVGLVLHLQANWLFTVAGKYSGVLQ